MNYGFWDTKVWSRDTLVEAKDTPRVIDISNALNGWNTGIVSERIWILEMFWNKPQESL